MASEQQKPKKEKKYFFRDFKTELKKVIWPTPKQLVNNTVAVISIVLIVAIIVGVLDFTFNKMNHYGIEGLKRVVQNDVEQTEGENEEQEENTNQETAENEEESASQDTDNEDTVNNEI